MARLGAAVAALASVWLFARALPADDDRPATAQLELSSGAAGCIDGPGLERAVQQRLGRNPFVAQGGDLKVSAQLAEVVPGEFRAELSLRAKDGRDMGARNIAVSAGHCSALDESLALVVALMIDVPHSETLPPLAEPAPAPPLGSARLPAPKKPKQIQLPRDTFAPREPWHFAISAFGILSLGRLPELAPGASLRIRVTPPRLIDLALSISWWSPQERTTDQGEKVRFRAGDAEFSACVPFRNEASELGVCGLQRLGVTWATATGFADDREARRVTLELGAAARGGLRLAGPLWFEAGLSGQVPLVRDRYVFRDETGTAQSIHQRPPLNAVAELGFGLHLP